MSEPANSGLNPAVRAFAEYAAERPDVQHELRQLGDGGDNIATRLADLASQHGFEFSAADYLQAVEREIRRQHRRSGVEPPTIDMNGIGGVRGYPPPLMP